MNLVTKNKEVRSIFLKNGSIFRQNQVEIANDSTGTRLAITPLEGTFSNNFIYKKNKNNVVIFSTELDQYEIEIENCFGVRIIEFGTVVLNFDFNEEERTGIAINGKLIKQAPYFWGAIINENYILNYPEGVFNNPRSFRCSDLLDTVTYWEYDCGECLEVNNQWFIWYDYLIFCKHKKGYYAGELVMIHLRTGEIKWKKKIPNVNLLFDEHQGLLVSFWASDVNGKNYQIINLEKETIDIGVFETNQKLENVNTFGQIQFLKHNKLYFSDNVRSYGEEIRPIKFGCFDIETKKIDFLQEVPEAAGSQFAQVIYHEDKLYLRTTNNELFIFGEE